MYICGRRDGFMDGGRERGVNCFLNVSNNILRIFVPLIQKMTYLFFI